MPRQAIGGNLRYRSYLKICTQIRNWDSHIGRGKDQELRLTRDRTLVQYHEMKQCVLKFPGMTWRDWGRWRTETSKAPTSSSKRERARALSPTSACPRSSSLSLSLSLSLPHPLPLQGVLPLPSKDGTQFPKMSPASFGKWSFKMKKPRSIFNQGFWFCAKVAR